MHFELVVLKSTPLASHSSHSRYVRTNVAARITGLSSRMMRHLAQTGVIPAVRAGLRCWNYEVSDLLNFREARLVAQQHGTRTSVILRRGNKNVLGASNRDQVGARLLPVHLRREADETNVPPGRTDVVS
jgi:hypothetical protein